MYISYMLFSLILNFTLSTTWRHLDFYLHELWLLTMILEKGKLFARLHEKYRANQPYMKHCSLEKSLTMLIFY